MIRIKDNRWEKCSEARKISNKTLKAKDPFSNSEPEKNFFLSTLGQNSKKLIKSPLHKFELLIFH